MPVRMRRIERGVNKGKFVVEDENGRRFSAPKSRAAARAQVRAVNIAMGFVPGVSQKRR